MKVLIIEDEAPAFRRLEKVLEEIVPEIDIVDVIDSVSESVKWWNNHKAPDLVFMDIQLSDGVSFEIFEQVKIDRPVIFTTAFDEYMLKAFKVNSIDYLLKPIKKEELAKSIDKYKNLKTVFGNKPVNRVDINELIKEIRLDNKQYKSRFLVKLGDQLIAVEASDISYFYTKNGLVYLVTKAGRKYIVDFTLDELHQQLDPKYFCRANRQFIVAFPAIKTTHRYYKGKLLVALNLDTEEKIIVSSEKASSFRAWLGDG